MNREASGFVNSALSVKLTHVIDHNFKTFSYNEHLGSTRTFLGFKVLVVSGTQSSFALVLVVHVSI